MRRRDLLVFGAGLSPALSAARAAVAGLRETSRRANRSDDPGGGH